MPNAIEGIPASIVQSQFKVYTYEILPMNTYQHIPEYAGPEEVRMNKNIILWNILTRDTLQFTRDGAEFDTRKLKAEGGVAVFRVSRHFDIELLTREALPHREEHWPYSFVIFDNDPTVQRIAIEVTPRGLRPEEIATLIHATLQEKLNYYSLAIYLNPVFRASDFWTTVEEYKNRIEWVQFEIYSPNLPRVHAAMDESLKALANETSSHATIVKSEAKRGEVLKVEHGEMIDTLAELSASGNGPITMKVKGIKQSIKIGKRTKTVQIRELTLGGSNETVIDAFKSMMKDADL